MRVADVINAIVADRFWEGSVERSSHMYVSTEDLYTRRKCLLENVTDEPRVSGSVNSDPETEGTRKTPSWLTRNRTLSSPRYSLVLALALALPHLHGMTWKALSLPYIQGRKLQLSVYSGVNAI